MPEIKRGYKKGDFEAHEEAKLLGGLTWKSWRPVLIERLADEGLNFPGREKDGEKVGEKDGEKVGEKDGEKVGEKDGEKVGEKDKEYEEILHNWFVLSTLKKIGKISPAEFDERKKKLFEGKGEIYGDKAMVFALSIISKEHVEPKP